MKYIFFILLLNFDCFKIHSQIVSPLNPDVNVTRAPVKPIKNVAVPQKQTVSDGYEIKNMRKMDPVSIPFQKQEKKLWCWAACLQSLFCMVKNCLTQSEIVSAFYLEPIDRALPFDSLASYLNITLWFNAVRTGRPATKYELVYTFMMNKKIIAFMSADSMQLNLPTNVVMGHSVMLQGLDDDLNVYVSDPETGITTKHPIDEVYSRWNWLDAIMVELKKQ